MMSPMPNRKRYRVKICERLGSLIDGKIGTQGENRAARMIVAKINQRTSFGSHVECSNLATEFIPVPSARAPSLRQDNHMT